MPATVSGTHARVAALKASGSLDTAFDGDCLINRRLAVDMGLPIRESRAKTEWGDGTPLPVHGETTVTIMVKKFKCKVTATVVDLGNNFDLLYVMAMLRLYANTTNSYTSSAYNLVFKPSSGIPLRHTTLYTNRSLPMTSRTW